MTACYQDVVQLVFAGVREFNELQSPASQLPLTEKTALLGHNHSLDSLAVVNLIAAIEEAVQAKYGAALCLSTHVPVCSADDPWRTIATLADFITARVNAQSAGSTVSE